MSKTVGQVHEFLMKLEEFGWDTDLTQKVITDKKLAQNIVLMASGQYELTKTVSLKAEPSLVIPPKNISKKDAFARNQWHSDNFKNMFLKGVSDTVTVPEQSVKIHTLTKAQNDFEICDELGGQSVLVQPRDAIAAQMHYVMNVDKSSKEGEKYRDGYANIWYYLDEKGRLCYVHCFWDAGGGVWDCYWREAGSDHWDAGLRVFSPAT